MIAAVVPAAGESRRMGTPKQLLPFGGTTVLGHVVDQLLASAVDEVCVVVGHEADRVADSLSARPVRIVVNPDCRAGMLWSIRSGLGAVADSSAAVLIALGDQPGITPELVDRMLQSFRTCGKGILVPVYDGKRGHPLLVSMRYRDEILARHDDVGLRGLLEAHPDDVLELGVSTPAVLQDLDDPEDYQRELARLGDPLPPDSSGDRPADKPPAG
jgi:molybdenum cofactor cytidylyltransferase